MTTHPIVIIGAGMAAYTVARELRKLDKTCALQIISKDGAGFYAKPMLSNAFAQNKQAQQLISQSCEQMATQLQANILTQTEVTAIDCARQVVLSSAGELPYSKLVLAVGAQPIQLRLAGDAAEQVMSVNHIDDYIALRNKLAALPQGAKLAILGGGLIGCEFADDLAGAGYQVAVADLNPLPMAMLASPALSRGLQAALEQRGVGFFNGTSATGVRKDADGLLVDLADGRTIAADLVISAVGLRADTRLAQQAGLQVGRGVQVDAFGKTSDPHIFALGDCAEYAIGDGRSVLPYVAPIMAAGRAIARSLTGEETPIEHKPVPVIVKTPSYPMALMPVPAMQAGAWQDEIEGARTVSRFFSEDEQPILLGFGLAPQEPGLRQNLLAGLGKPS